MTIVLDLVHVPLNGARRVLPPARPKMSLHIVGDAAAGAAGSQVAPTFVRSLSPHAETQILAAGLTFPRSHYVDDDFLAGRSYPSP